MLLLHAINFGSESYNSGKFIDAFNDPRFLRDLLFRVVRRPQPQPDENQNKPPDSTCSIRFIGLSSCQGGSRTVTASPATGYRPRSLTKASFPSCAVDAQVAAVGSQCQAPTGLTGVDAAQGPGPPIYFQGLKNTESRKTQRYLATTIFHARLMPD
jgi:hypothetical protein